MNQEPSLVNDPPPRLSTSNDLALGRDEDEVRDGDEGEGEAEGVDLRVPNKRVSESGEEGKEGERIWGRGLADAPRRSEGLRGRGR